MSLSVTISRGYLELDPLELEDPEAGFEVIDIGPGARTVHRDVVTSPVSDGAVMVGVTADMSEAKLSVRCFGETVADVFENMIELELALNQWAYVVTVTIDSVVESWTCHTANSARGDQGGTYNDGALLFGYQQDVFAVIPRHAIAYAYLTEE